MGDETSEFHTLIALHDAIKDFKLTGSRVIFDNFYFRQQGQNMHSFKKCIQEQIDTDTTRHLSCNAICTYALSQYYKLWHSEGNDNYEIQWRDFGRKGDFYNNIECNLLSPCDLSKRPDEFTIINTLYLIKKIDERPNKNLLKIVRALCKRFIYDEFAIKEKPHPLIYFRFYRLMTMWVKEISEDLNKDSLDDFQEWNKINDPSMLEQSGKSEEYKERFNNFKNEIDIGSENNPCSAILNYIFNKIYYRAKYELYRQISLYHAKDKTLFDVKRLIYSLLIVKERDLYSNNIVYDEALKIIFREQYETGLFSIGHVINNDFVIEKVEDAGDCDYFVKLIQISTRPIISSIECLNDIMDHYYMKHDIDKYEPHFRRAYEWIIDSLIKEFDRSTDPCHKHKDMARSKTSHDPCKKYDLNENDNFRRSLGWNPEYESTHEAESWVAGYCLLFLKNYCDMLSRLIKKEAKEDLQVVGVENLKDGWNKLLDSYNVKRYMGEMLKNGNKCRSALIFGPPGVGKSSIARVLAKELKWDYLEITPGKFLDEGNQNIIRKINEIFEKLNRLENTVVFFDEVDQLVKSREDGSESSDIWIVTALLPKLQELHRNKKLKFILATNHISRVDNAIMRQGRIDLVIPMGGICWTDRLHLMMTIIKCNVNKCIKIQKPIQERNLELLENNLNTNILEIGDLILDLKTLQKDRHFPEDREAIWIKITEIFNKNFKSFLNAKKELFGTKFEDIFGCITELKKLSDLGSLRKSASSNSMIDNEEKNILKKLRIMIEGIKDETQKEYLSNLLSNTDNMPFEYVKNIFNELIREYLDIDYKNKAGIFSNYAAIRTDKLSDIEDFDTSFRIEIAKEKLGQSAKLKNYYQIIRLPMDIEKLILDHERYIYIKEHMLDFCRFSQDRGEINIFRIGKLWVFKFSFGDNKLIKGYRENLDRFEFKSLDRALRLLERRGYTYNLVGDKTNYTVILPISAEQTQIFENSVATKVVKDERIFLMKDLDAKKEALEKGARMASMNFDF